MHIDDVAEKSKNEKRKEKEKQEADKPKKRTLSFFAACIWADFWFSYLAANISAELSPLKQIHFALIREHNRVIWLHICMSVGHKSIIINPSSQWF